MHRRRPFLNDANPGVAAAVDPTLVTLGYAKPPLEFPVVAEYRGRVFPDEYAGQETDHDDGHRPGHRVTRLPEPRRQRHERLLSLRDIPRPGVERGRDVADLSDVVTDRRRFLPDMAHAAVDAAGSALELLLDEPPFFASRFLWSDSRTSVKASAIRKPGGCSGPPLVVVRNPPHGRAVVQHDLAPGLLTGRQRPLIRPLIRPLRRVHDRGGLRWRLALLLQARLRDAPQAPDLPTHLDLGMTVGFRHRLGHVPEEMVVAIAVWYLGNCTFRNFLSRSR